MPGERHPRTVRVKSLDFGNQALFVQSAPQAVTCTNVSTTPQVLAPLTLPATILPSGTVTVNVLFTSADVGLRSATLSAAVQGVPRLGTTLLTGTGT